MGAIQQAFLGYGPSAPPSNALATLILARSPLGYWKCDDPSGTTMTDYSGNARHGSYNGGVTLGQSSLVTDPGNSINLTGGAYCEVAQAAWQNVPAIGVLFVYRPVATDAYQHIINKDASGTTGWWVRQNVDRTLEISVLTAAGRIDANTSPFTTANGASHIIEAGYDGTDIVIYVDGDLEGSGSFSSTISYSADPIFFGQNPAGFQYTGRLQHVAYFNAMPTAPQAAATAAAAGF